MTGGRGRLRRLAAASAGRGFTLIELLVVISLIMILSAVALVGYRTSVTSAKEAVLKEDLFRMRDAIDQYYADKSEYPASLDDLVSAKYLRDVPVDPFTRSRDTWQTVLAEPDPNNPTATIGLYDVKSGVGGAPRSTARSTPTGSVRPVRPCAPAFRLRQGYGGLAEARRAEASGQPHAARLKPASTGHSQVPASAGPTRKGRADRRVRPPFRIAGKLEPALRVHDDTNVWLLAVRPSLSTTVTLSRVGVSRAQCRCAGSIVFVPVTSVTPSPKSHWYRVMVTPIGRRLDGHRRT